MTFTPGEAIAAAIVTVAVVGFLITVVLFVTESR